ncbi:hypothetical protein [Pseudomonas grimontii]|uniref:hypothetical protein n=1 Tax=Pseudomonas grimontii TaxID=129847 RepID=UPI00387B2074
MRIKASVISTGILLALASFVAFLSAELSAVPVNQVVSPSQVFMVMFLLIVAGAAFSVLRPIIKATENGAESVQRRG